MFFSSLSKVIIALFFLFSLGVAKEMSMFQSVPTEKAQIIQTGKDRMYCPNCGMNLPMFWKTSHAVEFKDGTFRQFCSIYCLVEQLEITTLREKQDSIKKILVVDVESLKYIDAKEAFYVVGSKKRGTMTSTSKYAFKDEVKAKEFSKNFGGEVTNYDGAYKIAMRDFSKDTGLVLAKRGTKMYKMGEKIYNTKCDKAKLEKLDAHTMGEMKALIKDSSVCGELNDKQLQAVMLYYWDVKLKNFEKLYGKNEEVLKSAEQFKEKFKKMDRTK